MLTRSDWQKTLEAWERVHRQAEIDLEQSGVFIESCKKMIKSMKEEKPKCTSTQ